MARHHVQPVWLTIEGATEYSGLSKRLIQDLVYSGRIISSLVRKPGATRGRRLVNRASFDKWIQDGIKDNATPPLPHKPPGGPH